MCRVAEEVCGEVRNGKRLVNTIFLFVRGVSIADTLGTKMVVTVAVGVFVEVEVVATIPYKKLGLIPGSRQAATVVDTCPLPPPPHPPGNY